MNLRIYDDLLKACQHQNNILRKIIILSSEKKVKDIVKKYDYNWVNSVIERANELNSKLTKFE